jgi:hypothetical protein
MRILTSSWTGIAQSVQQLWYGRLGNRGSILGKYKDVSLPQSIHTGSVTNQASYSLGTGGGSSSVGKSTGAI